jgi:hypothetical protein
MFTGEVSVLLLCFNDPAVRRASNEQPHSTETVRGDRNWAKLTHSHILELVSSIHVKIKHAFYLLACMEVFEAV